MKINAVLLLILGTMISYDLSGQQTTQSSSPYFHVTSDSSTIESFPLKSSHTEVSIAGSIADVQVTQVYQNQGIAPIEAIYVFPASTQAAVYGMEMRIGQRVIVARIKEKQQARQIYDEAKAAGKRTSLLEQNRPNVFTMNVANLMPGDSVVVLLKFTEYLIPEKGQYTFVYPTVVGPRFHETSSVNARPVSTNAAGSADDEFVATPYLREDISTVKTSIHTTIQSGTPISSVVSPSHLVKTSYSGVHKVDVTMDPMEPYAGNRDYILKYRLQGSDIESGMLLYEHDDEKFFMLTVQPPKYVHKSIIPPREYVFVVDISGSMHGYPLDLCKTLLRDIIIDLRPTDRFNVLFFSGGSGWLSDTSVIANHQNMDMALNVIENQQGGGGTKILEALEKAMRLPRHADNLSRSYIIMTDGYVSVETETFDLIRNNLNKANCFIFGIGSSVNRHLIEGIAHVGRGVPFVVTKPEDGPAEVKKLQAYLISPVLTQLNVNVRDFDVYDVVPSTLPDLMSERPLTFFGKYRGKAGGSVLLTGKSADGNWSQAVRPAEYRPNSDLTALRYLWAREKLKYLSDYASVQRHSVYREEIVALGLKYNLLTKHTSFVAVDETEIVNPNGDGPTVKQPLPLPANVPEMAVGFDLSIEGITGVTIPKTIPGNAVNKSINAAKPDPAIAKARPSITLILGTDQNNENPFYSTAQKYYLHSDEKTDFVLTTGSLQQAKQILDSIAKMTALPWGEINLISHGNAFTGMRVPVTDGGPRASSVEIAGSLSGMPVHGVDRHTRLEVIGCALGEDKALINALTTAFSGRETPFVSASSYFIGYRTDMHNFGDEYVSKLHYRPYFAYYKSGYRPGDIRLTRQLQSRYPGVNIDWRKALKNASGSDELSPHTYAFRIPVKWIKLYETEPLPELSTEAQQLTWLRQQKALCDKLSQMDIPLDAFLWHIKPIRYRKEDGSLVPAIRARGVCEIACILEAVEGS